MAFLTACTGTSDPLSDTDVARQHLDAVFQAAEGELDFVDTEWVPETGCEVYEGSADARPLRRVLTRSAIYTTVDERIAAANVVTEAQTRWAEIGDYIDGSVGATFDRFSYRIDGNTYLLDFSFIASPDVSSEPALVTRVEFPC